ncbi:MAG: hypothetical protein KAI73_01520, partial [Rhodospirillaceae bacterium]|nr:hypothetical protein [Rhodospirillaceae bacterium]
PLDRLCHTHMSTLLACSYRGTANPGLLYDRGKFWQYSVARGAWYPWPEFRILHRIGMWSGHLYRAGDKVQTITLAQRTKESIMSCLRTECMPRTGRSPFDDAPAGIAFANGFLTLGFVLQPNKPENYAQWALPCDYIPKATLVDRGKYDNSLFSQYWNSIFTGPQATAKRQLIGEHMYAALAGCGPLYHRALLLLGPKGTGKSACLDMYEHLVPKGAVCNVTPQQMENDYHGAELIGKALNVCHELSSREAIPDESGWKAIVNGERITRRPIRQAPISFRPRCQHAFATNGHQRIKNPSDAYFDRWVIVAFEGPSWRDTDSAVMGIGQKIATDELCLLAAWVVDCGRSLVARGRYDLPDEHHAQVSAWRLRGDSVRAWVSECTDTCAGQPASRWGRLGDLFTHYTGWARASGFELANRAEFKSRLLSQGVLYKRSAGSRLSIKHTPNKAA